MDTENQQKCLNCSRKAKLTSSQRTAKPVRINSATEMLVDIVITARIQKFYKALVPIWYSIKLH